MGGQRTQARIWGASDSSKLKGYYEYSVEPTDRYCPCCGVQFLFVGYPRVATMQCSCNITKICTSCKRCIAHCVCGEKGTEE